MANLEYFFNPTSVAIVGVSKDPTKLGSVILSNLIEAKYEGDIYPVNPKYDELFGYKVYKNISEIDAHIELVCIVVPAKFVKDVLTECGKKGAKGAIIITAGFKETGEKGAALEDELISIAKKYKIKLLGPNCLGLISPKSNTNISFAASNPKEGSIAFLSQSGAFCTAVLDMSLEKNVGFSSFVSLGNKSDLNENEIFDYWLQDDDVKVISAYLEEISDGQTLLSIVNNTDNPKPIVMFKPGKTEEAAKAMTSHTGALAGSVETFRTAAKQAGITEVEEFNRMFYSMMGFAWSTIPQGKKVAIITNAGGPGIIATDQVIANGLEMATLSEETKNEIREHLPPTASVNNPIDVIGDALAERYKAPIDVLVNDENVDAIIVILTPQLVTQIEDTAKLIINSAKLSSKPIFAVFLGGKYILNGLQRLYDNKVPAFRYINDAVEVMADMFEYGRRQKAKKESVKNNKPFKDLYKGKYRKDVQKYIQKGGALPEDLVKNIAQEVHIDIPRQTLSKSLKEAKAFSEGLYPVVIKATTEVIAHKTDDQAIYLNLANEQMLEEAYIKLEKLLKTKFKMDVPEILIQEQIVAKEEVFVGANRDGSMGVYEAESSGFGHLIAFGKGGIYTEIYKDISYALVPASDYDIQSALKETKIYQIMCGARGQKPLAIKKVLDTINAVQKMVLLYPQIESIDINPLLLTEDRAVAVDLKIFVNK